MPSLLAGLSTQGVTADLAAREESAEQETRGLHLRTSFALMTGKLETSDVTGLDWSESTYSRGFATLRITRQKDTALKADSLKSSDNHGRELEVTEMAATAGCQTASETAKKTAAEHSDMTVQNAAETDSDFESATNFLAFFFLPELLCEIGGVFLT